ncbi:MAG TPA: T9SS type A sorting domain-containing protein, partial [Cyclobacteriaceae bacterium]|nr:T9SS type A sorting domain-containing protein [Cyclobacteriaceae bacterium]
GDPSVVKLSTSNYLAIYVGENYVTGIEDQSVDNELIVYPNPFDDYVRINHNLQVEYQYQIYSTTGVALTGKIDHERISTSQLSKGMYLLRIFSHNGQTKSVKIVKE